MADLTCGANGNTSSEVLVRINENTENISNITASSIGAVSTDNVYFKANSIGISSDGTALLDDDGTNNSNTGIGNNACKRIVTGSGNVGVGTSALTYNTSGSYNVAIGRGSLLSMTTGGSNSATGAESLYGVTTGSGNVGMGKSSGRSVGDGDYNTFIGYESGRNADDTYYGICIGYQAGYNLSGTYNNVCIGYQAGYNETNNHKLHIANNSSESLIEGDFYAKTLHLNVNQLNLLNIPTSDPSIVGAVWNSSGTLKISAG